MMRTLRISQNFVPVSEFKAKAADWLRNVAETGLPVVVTQKGRPAAVVLSPEAYDDLVERGDFVAAINEGLADVENGRVHSHADVTRRMTARFRTTK